MLGTRGNKVAGWVLTAVGVLSLVSTNAKAERLPIKTYTSADGLPVDIVIRINRDSRGFLWFGTRDGLSRFDGYQFTSYGKEQGLPHPQVNDLIQSSDGTYWAATNGGGVCSFNPAERAANRSASRFKVYSLDDNPISKIVNCLCEDSEGRIWAGADLGLFYFDKTQDRFIPAIPDAIDIYSLLADRQGVLWIGAGNQLWRRGPNGHLVRYSFQVARDLGRILSLFEDNKGKLWVGSWYAGLFELDPKLLPQKNSVLRVDQTKGLFNHYTTGDGSVIGTIQDLIQSPDGHLWIAASTDHTTSLGGGLFEFDGQRFRRYGKSQGITSNYLKSLAEDNEGNFWVGSVEGAMKIVRKGFTTFGEADGLVSGPIALFENKLGELCSVSERGMAVNCFRDGRFFTTPFNVPKALQNRKLWGSYHITFQDHEGDWWVPTLRGLMRFANVARTEQLARARPKAHYLLGGDRDSFDVFRMFEDARGDIWVSLASNAKNALVKWQRATETFRYYTEGDGVPSFTSPTAFCEDARGNLWMGLYGGGLLRYQAGRFTLFASAEGLPSGYITYLYFDRGQRLWIASISDGVGRTDDTSAERPTFVSYTIGDGLSSSPVGSIAEDNWGRLYFVTSRSVDRLNPATGNIKRYTAADGLPKGGGLGFRDRHGALWFSGLHELARLSPEPDEQLRAPAVLITGVRVNGDVQPIADLGETSMGGFEFGPSRNHIQIDFVGLAFGAGETLQYQYKLEGAERDWQPMTSLRTVNYASLAPGGYLFLVRAMNAEGQFSPAPASIEFTILAPIWQRWWFVAIVASLVGLIAYSLYRYRVGRLLELERVRTRIAADLHDDIGSNLSQIAIWSDVAQRQAGNDRGGRRPAEPADHGLEPLERIAATARETASAMSDIVWAINPRRDHLNDLTSRMRRFAGEAFDSRDIVWQLDAQQTRLSLTADTRREVFLIFKEGVTNIVRHSQCTRVESELKIEGNRLRLRIRDDGRGFDPKARGEGHGLESLCSRARNVGGELEVRSEPGKGTTLEFEMPLNQHRWRR